MLDTIIYNLFNYSADALNTAEKICALSRIHDRKGMADPRVFIAGLVLSGTLLIGLILYWKLRRLKNEDLTKQLFERNADRLALDANERKLLLKIAKYSKVKKIDSVFTVSFAYDQGAAVIMKKRFSAGKSLVERKHFNQQIVSLKEKLGFKDSGHAGGFNEHSFKRKGHSSRQVPVGRNVLISRVRSKDAYPMTATVAENSKFELKLQTESNFPGKPGERWRILYQLGSVVWKFDSLIVSAEANEVILSHTENVRFINRRKFVHAPVEMHGYIARFKCSKAVDDIATEILPQFVSAKVTELSGPNLKITAPLKLRTGERILVIFELAQNRVIQSIAEVRRCDNDRSGYVTVTELINVNESCINELVAATNNAVRGMAAKEEEEQFQQQANVLH